MTDQEGKMRYVFRHGRRIAVQTLDLDVPARPKRRWRRQFVQVPWSWVEALKGAKYIATYRVALYVLYEYWRSGGRPVKVSNVTVGRVGVNPDAKLRGLKELDDLGLVSVERNGKAAPLVSPRLGLKGESQ